MEGEKRHDEMAPGDEAPPGERAAGEDICPDCGGSGRIDGRACEACAGTGRVTTGIGGG
jgi:DnaJ-class molecular chaperone